MRILAVESSAISASAAVLDDDMLLAQSFVNNKLTHSKTLMPMIDYTLKTADISLESIDFLAVSSGPGSFTGIRIGVSIVKGIAFTCIKPCVSVSTLEAIAQNLRHDNAIICAVMDARRNQVYNAMFRAQNGFLTRLTPDRAISVEDLKDEILEYGSCVILAGDGAQLCIDSMSDIENVTAAPVNLRFQCGYGVAKAAQRMIKEGDVTDADGLNPIYLRPSQAEREAKNKK